MHEAWAPVCCWNTHRAAAQTEARECQCLWLMAAQWRCNWCAGGRSTGLDGAGGEKSPKKTRNNRKVSQHAENVSLKKIVFHLLSFFFVLLFLLFFSCRNKPSNAVDMRKIYAVIFVHRTLRTPSASKRLSDYHLFVKRCRLTRAIN